MVKSTLACGLQECLSKEWMGDNFSDFRVVVDGSEFFCHKFILSACSTFFKTLLRSDFKEKKEECVELKNMSKETFDVIINAIYNGVDGLTLDNVIDVWKAVHLLEIPFLIRECEKLVVENMSRDNFVEFCEMAKLLNSESVFSGSINFMKENFDGLTLDNVIDVWKAVHLLEIPFLIRECEKLVVENMSRDNFVEFCEMAKLLNSESVFFASINFMKENFDLFRKTETLLQLLFPVLFSLVDDDSLNAESEDLVLESILQWVTYSKIKTFPTEAKSLDIATEDTVKIIFDTNCPENSLSNSAVEHKIDDMNDGTDAGDGILDRKQGLIEQLSNLTVQTENETTCSEVEAESAPMCSRFNAHSEMFDRRKCLVELISTARTCLASRSYLEKLHNNPVIRGSQEALEIVHDALLYQWRSVSFPSNYVIPYRNCSGKRNVMAFVRNAKLHLFELNSERVVDMGLELCVGNCLASTESTLCFFYMKETQRCEVDTDRDLNYRHTCKTKNIAVIDSSKKVNIISKACGNSSLNLISFNGVFVNINNTKLKREPENNFLNIVECGSLDGSSSVCVFQDYIMGFSNTEKYNSDLGRYITCSNGNFFNFYTKTSQTVVVDGPSENIISIQKGRHMFILQINGALSSVGMTEDTKLEITFFIQLWENFDWILNGAVYYKNDLILFCSVNDVDEDTDLLKSVPGVFERIRVVELQNESNVVPWVVPESWITSHS